MVIPMNTWMTKYQNHPDFMSFFESEQDYIDAMFMHMIMYNFGVFLRPHQLYRG